jgi:Fic family protein
MPPDFRHFDLRLVEPQFSSDLTNLVMELHYLKRYRLSGKTPPRIFFQLKEFFHLLESLSSARIEGNITTIAELVETQIDPQSERTEQIREIENMSHAMEFIEEVVEESKGINQALIFELHKKTVTHLTREGDKTPGYFRRENVKISGSNHRPPDYTKVQDYMTELIDFFNRNNDSKYDLLKIALTHHRFAWVHPFQNGNGRVARLLTYAMLIERGFNVETGRILNPSAVFCNDRETYYKMLSEADSGTDKGLLKWCKYVLTGLRDELTKIDKLLNYDFLSQRILKPAIRYTLERKLVTDLEASILNLAVDKTIFRSADLVDILPGKGSVERSRSIARLRNRKLITPIAPGTRRYVMSFSNSLLLRGITHALAEEQFITLDS